MQRARSAPNANTVPVDYKLQATHCAIDFALRLEFISGTLVQKLWWTQTDKQKCKKKRTLKFNTFLMIMTFISNIFSSWSRSEMTVWSSLLLSKHCPHVEFVLSYSGGTKWSNLSRLDRTPGWWQPFQFCSFWLWSRLKHGCKLHWHRPQIEKDTKQHWYAVRLGCSNRGAAGSHTLEPTRHNVKCTSSPFKELLVPKRWNQCFPILEPRVPSCRN